MYKHHITTALLLTIQLAHAQPTITVPAPAGAGAAAVQPVVTTMQAAVNFLLGPWLFFIGIVILILAWVGWYFAEREAFLKLGKAFMTIGGLVSTAGIFTYLYGLA